MLNREKFAQQKIKDIIDAIYKGALTEQALAGAAKARREPDERTTAQKNYEYATKQGYTGTLDDFINDSRTAHQKEYEQAVSEGYEGNFQDWLRDITALGGGLNLEEYKKRREVTADVEAKKYFTDPKGLAQDVDKYINSEEVQSELFQYADNPKERSRQVISKKAERVESKITSAGGKVQNVRMEGRTRIWTVKWPDGTTSEVSYAF